MALFVVLLGINITMWPASRCPGDTNAWLREANALLDSASLRIQADRIPENLLREPGKFFVVNPRNQQLYSKYGVGSSVAILPAVWVSRQLPLPEDQALVFSLNAEYSIVAAILGTILYCLARRVGASLLTAYAFVFAALYGTFAWQYLRAQTMDLFLCVYFSAWLLLVAIWRSRFSRDAADRPSLLIAIWLMVLMLAATRAIFFTMVPITLFVLGRDIFAAKGPGRALRFAFGSLLPTLGIALILGALNHIKFGAWYYTGYHQWSTENNPSPANVLNLYEFITDPHFSPFITFPVFAISLFGARRFWNEHRNEYLLAIVPAVLIGSVYLLTHNWRGEWAEGPRYFLFALPAVSLPFAGVLGSLLSTAGIRSKAYIALIAAWLLWSGTMQYLVLCRPFFAYNYHLAGPIGATDRRFAGLTTIAPRGYTMERVWTALRLGRPDPFLEGAKEILPGPDYARYEQSLRSALAPGNLWWFPEDQR